MAHPHLRKEKNCLNCNAVVAERYCQHCGQENTVPKETVGHLVGHFIADITHFDGKFFSSMKYLLIRPGYLSREYIQGKRVSYLNPIRMYLFTSAIIFVILSNLIWHTHDVVPPAVTHFRDSVAQSSQNNIGIGEVYTSQYYDLATKDDYYYLDFSPNSKREGAKYYDSLVRAEKKNSSFIHRFLVRNISNAGYSYARNPNAFLERFKENLVHSASQVFFISLPLFAGVLWLLFVRRRKQFYFVSHAIFSLHFYCIAFISFLLIVFANYLDDTTGIILMLAVIFGTLAYLYIAMRRFYKQGWFKTLLKALIISLYQLIALSIITIYFIAHSFNSATVL